MYGNGVRAVAAVSASFLLAGCTDRPAPVVSPAPRTCPVFDVRADAASPAELGDRLRGHVPEYLPDGFGLDSVWGEGDHTLGSASWADAQCRTVTVVLAVSVPDDLPSGPRVGNWVVTINAPGCGTKFSAKRDVFGI